MKIRHFIIAFFLPLFLSAQTVGLLTKTDQALDGYTFFSPFSGTKAYMVDNCGNLINEWDRGTRPGLSAYFLDNGLMLRTYKADLNGPFTSASNAGGLELVDWDNNTVWRYEINTAEQLSHHDAVMMPNGNILVLTWQLTYTDELVDLGRDPDEIANEGFMWSEKILEIQPVGSNAAEIIWEWHINDHYIQDFDASKENFGVVADHPELFDINQPELGSNNSNATRDWNHFNAIDYNEALDQILISVRNSDEIWIIDHSTSTAEAATHSGGTYGKGGDILYRWGNASAYKGAPTSEQELFGQHGVNWIQEGLVDAGKIMIYNNGNGQPGQDYSQVEVLNPPQASPGFYILDSTGVFGPALANTIYGDQQEERFYSAFLSNAQRLTNGNTLINAGSPGLIFEVTPEDDIAWAYEIPLFGDTPATQGNPVNNNGNFRAYKYPLDFTGFDGLDLTPGSPIENNPLDCDVNVSLDEVDPTIPSFIYDAQDHRLIIVNESSSSFRLQIFDFSGRLVFTTSRWATEYDISALGDGLYLVTCFSDDKIDTAKIIKAGY